MRRRRAGALERWRTAMVAALVASSVGVVGGAEATALPPDPPRVSVGSASVVEGQLARRYIRFVIALSWPSSSPVTVQYTTVDETATVADGDYRPKAETLTFNPGQTVKYRSVLVFSDGRVEGDETFALQLSSPTNATLGIATGVGTIIDDDPNVGPRVAIGDSASPETCRKPPSTIPVVVTLSVRHTVPVTVSVATVPGTASATTDYRPVAKTITFKADQTLKEVRVRITPDELVEGDEELTMTLTLVDGPGQVSKSVGTLRILDCDPS